MQIEELLNKVETTIAERYRSGFPITVGEIYILTDQGFSRLSFVGRTKRESMVKLKGCTELVASMTKAGRVRGIVQVSTAWMSAPKEEEEREKTPRARPKRTSVLVFNGANPTGNRIRMYGIKKIRGKRVAATLAGSYRVVQMQQEDVD